MFLSLNSFASITPVSELTIISNNKVELAVSNVLQKDFFLLAEYNDTMDALDFVTKDFVNYIQIFNSKGELEYQLPVMSKKLKISRKMFKEGKYKVGFITNKNKTIQFTDLRIN